MLLFLKNRQYYRFFWNRQGIGILFSQTKHAVKDFTKYELEDMIWAPLPFLFHKLAVKRTLALWKSMQQAHAWSSFHFWDGNEASPALVYLGAPLKYLASLVEVKTCHKSWCLNPTILQDLIGISAGHLFLTSVQVCE